MGMRQTLLVAFATAAILSGGLPKLANAMTPATPSELGFASPDAAFIQRATVVCGNNGCSPVQTKRVQRRKLPQH
jgi:hypothetical protein